LNIRKPNLQSLEPIFSEALKCSVRIFILVLHLHKSRIYYIIYNSDLFIIFILIF